ncbi:MAG: site-specific integrase [Prevotellaceae bacterium]|nr:site-specific integrase [Prevotellaceae bacterium]
MIDQNPASRAKVLKTTNKPAAQTYYRALTEEEQLLFMQAAQNSYYYEFFALLLLTGLRHGEAAALTWGDIDWSANVIRVCRTLTYDLDGHTVTGPPKSASSRREIPMNEQIRTILQRQAKKTANLLEMDSWKQLEADQRVFFHRLHPDGFLNNRTANIELRKVLQQLSDEDHPIQSFTLHAFRDTFATRFIEQGGNPQTLKTLLGHSNLSMTMDLYSQVMESTRQKEMDQMEITI